MSDCKETTIESIINDGIKEFLRRIDNACEIGPYRRFRKVSPSFEILEPANKEYYEYKYFERSLESQLRALVNSIFSCMFEYLYKIDSFWPEDNDLYFDVVNKRRSNKTLTVYTLTSNERYEDRNAFEFILRTSVGRIGFRYTSLITKDESLLQLLHEYDLDHIEVIDWTMKEESSGEGVYGVSDDKTRLVKRIHLRDFFTAYLNEADYPIFIKLLKEAVALANHEIGFSTIPRLSLRYLSSFKEEVLSHLSSANTYTGLNYVFVKKTPSNIALPESDQAIINDRFFSMKLYKAFTGRESFANCFITSEYLYSTISGDYSIDYTAVVCGYLKAMEQLLYRLIEIQLVFPPSDKDRWISSCLRKKRRMKLIEDGTLPSNWFKDENPSRIKAIPDAKLYFKTELGSLINYLEENSDVWSISPKGKSCIIKALRDFKQCCRNDHFHKDNIDLNAYSDVQSIRNNTIYLFYVVLGGIKLATTIEETHAHLGIMSTEFDRLYKRLKEIPKSINKFYIEFPDGEERKVVRLFEQPKTQIDSSGSLHNSKIVFAYVDDFKFDDYNSIVNSLTDQSYYILDEKHMPKRIWFAKPGGQRGLVEY